MLLGERRSVREDKTAQSRQLLKADAERAARGISRTRENASGFGSHAEFVTRQPRMCEAGPFAIRMRSFAWNLPGQRSSTISGRPAFC